MKVEDKNDYRKRVDFYKSVGFDIEAAREFIIEKSQPISGRILEVGTGKGYFAVALANKGYEFISVDASDEEQEIARQNINKLGLDRKVFFRVEDAQKLSYKDDSFDIVFAINLIHHLSDLHKVVDQMIRVTKPGGRLVISDFNREGFDLIAKIHQSEGRHHGQGDFSLKDATDYLKSKGIKVEEHKGEFDDIVIAYP